MCHLHDSRPEFRYFSDRFQFHVARMFRSLCKFTVRTNSTIGPPPPHLLFVHFFSLKSLSTTSKPHTRPSTLTLHYLTVSRGFSRESALAAAHKVDIKSTATADSVIELFESFGFTPTHIRNIISSYPSFLVANPRKSLKPKLDFLSRNGIAGSKLVDIISACPYLLTRSLENHFIPCFNLLNGFFRSSDDFLSLFSSKRLTRVLHYFAETMKPNIETLRSHGVPYSGILKMMVVQPRTLSRAVDEFNETVLEVKELGFDPLSLMFVHGVIVMSAMRRHKWESKVEVLKSYGWSEAEVKALFVKQPMFMKASEERLRRALDFFVNTLQWTVVDITKYPPVLLLSFEKRVLPRSTIVRYLVSKGLRNSKCMGRALMLSEANFLENFITNYQDEVPQLLEMYENRTRIIL